MQIFTVTLILIGVASFYIYQRVWVRNLVMEVERLEEKNQEAREFMALMQSDWQAAISLAELEVKIDRWKLALRPTVPTQNLAMSLQPGTAGGRFGGLVQAFDKLKSHLPFVSLNETEAEELFEDK